MNDDGTNGLNTFVFLVEDIPHSHLLRDCRHPGGNEHGWTCWNVPPKYCVDGYQESDRDVKVGSECKPEDPPSLHKLPPPTLVREWKQHLRTSVK